MDHEEAKGPVPWRNFEKPWEGGTTAKASSSNDSHLPVSCQIPSLELFLPENRKKLLEHLAEYQFPAIRDLVADLLGRSYFLLEPAELSLRVVEKMVIEADEYNEQIPYWDWVRSVAASAMHESVMGLEEAAPEAENARLRRAFNRLALDQRRGLYLVAVLGHSVDDAARISEQETEELIRDAREGLRRVYREIEGGNTKKGGNSHDGE